MVQNRCARPRLTYESFLPKRDPPQPMNAKNNTSDAATLQRELQNQTDDHCHARTGRTAKRLMALCILAILNGVLYPELALFKISLDVNPNTLAGGGGRFRVDSEKKKRINDGCHREQTALQHKTLSSGAPLAKSKSSTQLKPVSGAYGASAMFISFRATAEEVGS